MILRTPQNIHSHTSNYYNSHLMGVSYESLFTRNNFLAHISLYNLYFISCLSSVFQENSQISKYIDRYLHDVDFDKNSLEAQTCKILSQQVVHKIDTSACQNIFSTKAMVPKKEIFSLNKILPTYLILNSEFKEFNQDTIQKIKDDVVLLKKEIYQHSFHYHNLISVIQNISLSDPREENKTIKMIETHPSFYEIFNHDTIVEKKELLEKILDDCQKIHSRANLIPKELINIKTSLVGGALRDFLLQEKPNIKDLDLFLELDIFPYYLRKNFPIDLQKKLNAFDSIKHLSGHYSINLDKLERELGAKDNLEILISQFDNRNLGIFKAYEKEILSTIAEGVDYILKSNPELKVYFPSFKDYSIENIAHFFTKFCSNFIQDIKSNQSKNPSDEQFFMNSEGKTYTLIEHLVKINGNHFPIELLFSQHQSSDYIKSFDIELCKISMDVDKFFKQNNSYEEKLNFGDLSVFSKDLFNQETQYELLSLFEHPEEKNKHFNKLEHAIYSHRENFFKNYFSPMQKEEIFLDCISMENNFHFSFSQKEICYDLSYYEIDKVPDSLIDHYLRVQKKYPDFELSFYYKDYKISQIQNNRCLLLTDNTHVFIPPFIQEGLINIQNVIDQIYIDQLIKTNDMNDKNQHHIEKKKITKI